jgi:carbon-monoxide dehydrogenase medium subunit
VKPAPFTYRLPATLGEAVRLLEELAPQDGRVLAGGERLVPIMAFRLARPAYLVDINVVAGLDVLTVRDEILHLGARAHYAVFHRPVQCGPLGAMLAAVVSPPSRIQNLESSICKLPRLFALTRLRQFVG